MTREYRMRKRAEAQDRTRERIIQATMQVHDEKGVAPATFAEIAARAGIGQATLHRHFPTLGDLVRACGRHVWQEMRPPVPEGAAAVFDGARTNQDRLRRLVEELDAFYERGELRLALAARDRQLVPELDGFLTAVEAGIAALVRAALQDADGRDPAVPVVIALTSFAMWQQFRRSGLPAAELPELKVRILGCAIKAAQQAGRAG